MIYGVVVYRSISLMLSIQVKESELTESKIFLNLQINEKDSL